MKYKVVLIHEREKLNRQLSFESYDIAEASYNNLAKSLITDKDVIGDYNLSLIRIDNSKILMTIQKSLD